MHGETVGELARRFGCTPKAVHRALREARGQRIQELPLKYCFSPEFLEKDARTKILGPPPESASKRRKVRPPQGLPAYLASLYEIPLLSAAEERHLFRKLNFLKYLAAGLRRELRRADPSARLLDEIERLYAEAVATKNTLISSNLRLVVSFAKRDLRPQGDLFELISDGNLSLMRAVDRFDYSRGFKFSTYASWAIRKNYARDGSNRRLHSERFRTGFDDSFVHRPENRSDPYQEEAAHRHRVASVRRLLRHLTDRERQIIKFRFGLHPGSQPCTLQEVGTAIGVSKERARQLATRAIRKLRIAAEQGRMDGPAP
jgi:RNA polymerase primary sigma factor/RNA polymerase sigma factor